MSTPYTHAIYNTNKSFNFLKYNNKKRKKNFRRKIVFYLAQENLYIRVP